VNTNSAAAFGNKVKSCETDDAKIFYCYYYYYFTPVLDSQGMKKLRYAIQKSTKIKLE